MPASVESNRSRGVSDLVRAAPGWVVLGTASSALVAVTGARLGGGTVRWWFHPHVLSGAGARIVFYAAVAGLVVAWLGLGLVLARRALEPRGVWVVVVLWCAPLALGAALFSRDLYSYLAQGTIAHLGLNPYHYPPAILGRLGQTHVLGAVDPFWRGATAPYGPLFIGAVSLIVGLTGSHLIAGVLLIRAVELAGLALLVVFVPRAARAAGADPTRALWLAALSPLVLLQLVAAGHNDLLMIGVMAAGVALALEGRWLWGVAVCALAATIKVPAVAAVVFVTVAWARTAPGWHERLVRCAKAATITVALAGAVTLITGFGPGWISGALFSTPAKVRLAITPATDIGWTLASLLRDLGAAVTFHGVESVLRVVVAAASVLLALQLLRRGERRTLPYFLGLALIAFALGGPAAWPWYLTWGLVMLACWPAAQRSRAVIVAVLVGSFLVKPDGILALPLDSSPVVASLWLALGAAALYRISRRVPPPRAAQHRETLGAAPSLVAEP